MAADPQLKAEEYTVGWLCAIAESELTAARRMLDRPHRPPINRNVSDQNTYHFGDIEGHNLVITCMPPGQTGTVSAQRLVQPLRQSFPNLGIHLFVGIGGGIPRRPPSDDPLKDIHLGDVVIGWPDRTGVPAIISYDHVRSRDEETSLLGLLDKPSHKVLSALNPIISDREMNENRFQDNLQYLRDLKQFQYPGLEKDLLFEADYLHSAPRSAAKGSTMSVGCNGCSPDQLVKRPPRNTTNPEFHQGTILSGNIGMQNGRRRDEESAKHHEAICIEMEAAGVIDDTHCLVIRGISDYADGYKSGSWEYYAAATAAAFAREVLRSIRPAIVETFKSDNNDLKDIVAAIMEQGEKLVQPGADNKASDLETALRYFIQARDMLLQAGIFESSFDLKVNFRLMTVECDLSHNQEHSVNDQIANIRRAEQYGVQASRAALITSNAVKILQVRLEQCFLKGRKAELEDKRGTEPTEIRRVKAEALQEMNSTMEELRQLDQDKSGQYERRVSRWQDRLIKS